jgi:hypothetical protein
MLLRTLAVAIFALGFAVGAAGADEYRGVLIKVDGEKKEIVVDVRNGGRRGTSVTVTVDKDTAVLFGSTPGNLSDLAVGKRVRVSVETRDGKNIATVIYPFGLKPASVTRGEDKPGTGTLRAIAAADKKLTVASRGKDGKETETTYSIPDSAKITRSDKTIKLDELKTGERVTIDTEKKGDQTIVAAVQVLPPDPSDIQKVRGILKEIDFALQLLELRQATKKP